MIFYWLSLVAEGASAIAKENENVAFPAKQSKVTSQPSEHLYEQSQKEGEQSPSAKKTLQNILQSQFCCVYLHRNPIRIEPPIEMTLTYKRVFRRFLTEPKLNTKQMHCRRLKLFRVVRLLFFYCPNQANRGRG